MQEISQDEEAQGGIPRLRSVIAVIMADNGGVMEIWDR